MWSLFWYFNRSYIAWKLWIVNTFYYKVQPFNPTPLSFQTICPGLFSNIDSIKDDFCCCCRYTAIQDLLDEHSNPLVWWRENKDSYPLLAMFVRANFSFQCTSVASERIFNKVMFFSFLLLNILIVKINYHRTRVFLKSPFFGDYLILIENFDIVPIPALNFFTSNI